MCLCVLFTDVTTLAPSSTDNGANEVGLQRIPARQKKTEQWVSVAQGSEGLESSWTGSAFPRECPRPVPMAVVSLEKKWEHGNPRYSIHAADVEAFGNLLKFMLLSLTLRLLEIRSL